MTREIFVPLLLAFAAGMVGCSESTSMPTGPSAPELVTVSPPAPSPAPVPVPPAPVAPPTARYEVTFDSTWSASTHPTDFPADAHYSGLVGGTHTSGATFWRPGSLASEGIRRMAERGAKSPLTEEVGAAITAGTAQYVLSGGDLPTSPGSVRMEFDISQTFPLVTLVTMIAPSPDWFVGVAGLPLFENDRPPARAPSTRPSVAPPRDSRWKHPATAYYGRQRSAVTSSPAMVRAARHASPSADPGGRTRQRDLRHGPRSRRGARNPRRGQDD